jgi:predicted ATPase
VASPDQQNELNLHPSGTGRKAAGQPDLSPPKNESKPGTSPPRFGNIHLENWRNFTRVSVPLQERNFLVGPNASGKSNFLDAFRFLSELVSVGGGLESASSKRGGVSVIRCLAARQHSDVGIEVVVSNGAAPAWRYSLKFSQSERRPLVREESVYRGERLILQRPDKHDVHDPERLRQTHLEQVAANREFREVADFFRSIRYYHLVPQLVRESERWDGLEVDPFGGDFLEGLMQTNVMRRTAWLKRIQSALGVAGPRLTALVAERDKRGIPHLKGKYEHWRPQGAWQDERQFSDGTLRLIGLFWSLLAAPGPLLLEEPELSLHPEVVRHLPQLMTRVQGRTRHQIFLSTHSTDLLRDRGIASDEVFLFTPSKEGTNVQTGASLPQVRRLLESGLSVAEVVMPMTRPPHADQLAFSLG